MTLEKEFEYDINGVTEYFTVTDVITIGGTDYVIADNEYGFKKVFIYDIMDEELTPVEESEEEDVLEAYDNDEYERSALLDDDPYYFTDDDGEYVEYDSSDSDIDDSFIVEDLDEEDDEIDDDFLDSLF